MTEAQAAREPLAPKLQSLRRILKEMHSVVLAYSGGVDSTFLLKVLHEELGDRMIAVTAVSPTYTREEYETACSIARSFGAPHLVITTDELHTAGFAENTPDRCYYCKRELFTKLRAIADEKGFRFVADASNLDDCADYRPGRKAACELAVRSPLVEAGLAKSDIRAFSRNMGLPTWNKPAMACLASRFPYGEGITEDKLARVGKAEQFLRQLGFDHVRVRSHGAIARIEVPPERIAELAASDMRARVAGKLRALGFAYVALDLQGYRTGSMNEVLPDRS